MPRNSDKTPGLGITGIEADLTASCSPFLLSLWKKHPLSLKASPSTDDLDPRRLWTKAERQTYPLYDWCRASYLIFLKIRISIHCIEFSGGLNQII